MRDTTITLTSGIGVFNVMILSTSGEVGSYEYRITAVDTNDITFVRHLKTKNSITQRIKSITQEEEDRYYESVDSPPVTSPYASARSNLKR